MTDSNPLVQMTDRLDHRAVGHSGYVTTVEELERICSGLSRLTPISVIEGNKTFPGEVRVNITLAFSLERGEIEALRARPASEPEVDARDVAVLKEHTGLMHEHNRISCGAWECDGKVIRDIAGHARHQAEMLSKARKPQ